MFKSFCARWLSVSMALLGCGGAGEGNHTRPRSSGAGGGSGELHASAGTPGASTIAGATSNGGMLGNGGGSGSAGSAGSAASAGSGGRAAGDGLGGAPAVGGSAVGGSSAGGGTSRGGGGGSGGRGPAPTFTMIYERIITPTCGGTQCHLKRPTPFGYDFSSKSAASASWRADVLPGDADNSPMFQVVNFAIMPKDRPPLSIEQLYLVYDWINAGALDN
jgi:hypothetical protein